MGAFDDTFIEAAEAMGFRELVGDELIANRMAHAFADEMRPRFPFPMVTRDMAPEAYVAALEAWRTSMNPIEADLRSQAAAARKVIASVTALLDGPDPAVLSDTRPAMIEALRQAKIREMFAGFALQEVCRKGAGKKDYAVEAAAMQLFCTGLSRNRIALLLGLDRSNVRAYLTHMDEIVDAMRWALDLVDAPPWERDQPEEPAGEG